MVTARLRMAASTDLKEQVRSGHTAVVGDRGLHRSSHPHSTNCLITAFHPILPSRQCECISHVQPLAISLPPSLPLHFHLPPIDPLLGLVQARVPSCKLCRCNAIDFSHCTFERHLKSHSTPAAHPRDLVPLQTAWLSLCLLPVPSPLPLPLPRCSSPEPPSPPLHRSHPCPSLVTTKAAHHITKRHSHPYFPPYPTELPLSSLLPILPSPPCPPSFSLYSPLLPVPLLPLHLSSRCPPPLLSTARGLCPPPSAGRPLRPLACSPPSSPPADEWPFAPTPPPSPPWWLVGRAQKRMETS